MLKKIIERARAIYSRDDAAIRTYSSLDYFLSGEFDGIINAHSMEEFCSLDDADVTFAIKRWSKHPDVALSTLCTSLLNRKLLRCTIQGEPFDETILTKRRQEVAEKLGISENDASYLVFAGEAVNTTYNPGTEHINIYFKSGAVKNISQVDNPLIHQTLSTPVKKFYFCTLA